MSRNQARSSNRVRLRPHDAFDLIRLLARSQSDPRKAVAELVQNSLDAGARRVEIVWFNEKGRRALRIAVEDASGRTAEDLLFIEISGDRVLLVVMARPVQYVSEWAPWFEGSLATLEIWDAE